MALGQVLMRRCGLTRGVRSGAVRDEVNFVVSNWVVVVVSVTLVVMVVSVTLVVAVVSATLVVTTSGNVTFGCNCSKELSAIVNVQETMAMPDVVVDLGAKRSNCGLQREICAIKQRVHHATPQPRDLGIAVQQHHGLGAISGHRNVQGNLEVWLLWKSW